MGKITPYVPEAEPRAYDQDVAELIAAGPMTKTELDPVPAEVEQSHRRRFGEAANRADRSAKLVDSVLSEDGKTVTLTFTLIAKRGRPQTAEGGNVDPAAPGA